MPKKWHFTCPLSHHLHHQVSLFHIQPISPTSIHTQTQHSVSQSSCLFFLPSKEESMELCAYPVSFSLSSYVPELSVFWGLVKRIRPRPSLALSAAFANFLSAVFTFLFAFVGTTLGALTGALIGQETESGFVRGAAVGAISGAVFSIEVFESSKAFWQSEESGFRCLLYLIDVIVSLASGRLVRERIGPAMLSAVHTQMHSSEVSFEDVPNIFDTSSCKGMAGDSLEKLPKITINSDNNVDESGENVCCSVCLQDFQLGETARCLPHCRHTFHLPCIDKWLLRHGSCPMCRRDLELGR